MNTPLDTVLNPLVMTLGMALLNFIWQGALIGMLCAAALKLLHRASPQSRYAISGLALTLCLLLPLLAVIGHVTDTSATGISGDAISAENAQQLAHSGLSALWNWAHMHLTGLVAIWALCVLIFSARLLLGLIWVQRISRPEHCSTNASWQAQLNDLAKRAGISQPVLLRVVEHLTSPAVVGWMQPVVLMPAALISGMSPDLLRALLAHELAHVSRMDYLLNLFQSSVEILLFYHPVVWWISGQIRIERELIADQLAAGITGEPHRLALALRELEQMHYVSQMAISASGGNLAARIKRLAQPQRAFPGSRMKVVIPVLSVMLVSLALVASAATPSGTDAIPAKATIDFSSCAKPDYPALSLANKAEGTVEMSFVIDTSGHITKSAIDHSSGHSALDEAAFLALNKCRFTPSIEHGKPVISATRVTYVWKLPD